MKTEKRRVKILQWLRKFWKGLMAPPPIKTAIIWANYYDALNKAKEKKMKCSNCANFKEK